MWVVFVVDFCVRVEVLCFYLVKFVLLQFCQCEVVEDVVQEMLFVVFGVEVSFVGCADLCIWFIGIFKYKIVDVICCSSCECLFEVEDGMDGFDVFFNECGYWVEYLELWVNFDGVLYEKQFFVVL